MFDTLSLFLIKYNRFYPDLFGLGYLKYRRKIKHNYYRFDSLQELFTVVNSAIKDIPYYHKQYPYSIKSYREFQENIKPIDKDTVMDNWNDFIHPRARSLNTVVGTTGGTSGKPLKLILPKNRYIFELATMYTMWKNIGWKGHTRVVIRNHHLGNNQIFKINLLTKEVIFDGFRTKPEYYAKIYRIIKKHRIKFIHAYPSSAYQFAVYLHKEKLDISFVKGFLCGSEGLLPEQKELIENQLGIKIFNWYGHSEKLILGGYCKESDLIHLEPTYGHFELIDEDGNPVTEIGKIGEIVGTTLHNPYMPLIRYRTGDFAEYAGNYCSHCKRHLPLIKNIQGRWDENKIFLNDGSFISITALNLHNDFYTYIDGLQYIQKKKGELLIHLIKGDNFNSEIESKFKKYFDKALKKNNCSYRIEFVSQIKKEKNGKFLPLKQFVDKE